MASRKLKTTKPLLLLLDACVIIEAYRLDVWGALLSRAQVAAPATVVRTEALFYSQDKHCVPQSIHLPTLVAEGKMVELSATTDELAVVQAQLTDDVIEGLDPGEMEALALLVVGRAAGYLLCTGDRAAIQALALLGLSALGISFEHALARVGLKKPLSKQFTEKYFRTVLREGQERRLRGLGLKKLPSL